MLLNTAAYCAKFSNFTDLDLGLIIKVIGPLNIALPTKWYVHPVKTQTSLGKICGGSSEFLLYTWRNYEFWLLILCTVKTMI